VLSDKTDLTEKDEQIDTANLAPNFEEDMINMDKKENIRPPHEPKKKEKEAKKDKKLDDKKGGDKEAKKDDKDKKLDDKKGKDKKKEDKLPTEPWPTWTNTPIQDPTWSPNPNDEKLMEQIDETRGIPNAFDINWPII